MAPARDVDDLIRRRLGLLGRVGALGSITAAAKDCGLSYKGAWSIVEALNAASDVPLVETSAGGARGGGARLTAAGARLVSAYRRVDAERLKFLRGLGGKAGELAPMLGWLRRLSMRTSARNQFFGRVASLRRGAVNAELSLRLAGGDRLVAVITNASLDDLGLRRGDEAFALVKASWITLAVGEKPRVSAGNVFRGVVETVREGPVSAEVSLRLSGGTPVVAVLTRDSVRDLGLAPGSGAWAFVNAANVIIGVQQ